MDLSRRIRSINNENPSDWEIHYITKKLVANGASIVDLTIGEHDIGTDSSILEAMYTSAISGNTGYAPIPGQLELRKAIAKRVEEQTKVETTFRNILVTPGGQAALFATLAATADEGDKALYLDPFYATYPGTIKALGLIPVPVLTQSYFGFEPQKPELVNSAYGAKSLLINSPNNPTGAVYSSETIHTIANVCKENDLWLISDEVYNTQVWQGKHISPRSLPRMAERTLVVGSMSKSHAMTGSRIGWVIGPEEVVSGLTELATRTTYGVAGYIQDAALFAINQGEILEKKVSAPFERRKGIATKVLSNFPSLKYVVPKGGMYLMIDIRNTGLSGKDFANQLLYKHSIAVMPGESFGKSAAGHLRVAMTESDPVFQEALEKLCVFAKQLCSL